MRQTKIVIKCNGLTVRTKDLGMGLSILSRLKEHGIMNHVEVPVSLLDKANELLKGLCDKLEEYLPKWGSDATEELDDSFESALVTVTRMGEPRNTDVIKKPHVFIRSGIMSNEQKKKSDDIEKTLVDAIEKETLVKSDDIKVTVNESNARQLPWTEEEINVLKNNFSVTDKELDRLIPNRTLEAIRFKRRFLLGKVGNKKASGKKRIRWSNKELKALATNMHLKPRALQKLPWLKRRTLDQINQKKHSLKKDIIARENEISKIKEKEAEESYEG